MQSRVRNIAVVCGAALCAWALVQCSPAPGVYFLCEIDGGCAQPNHFCDETNHCVPDNGDEDAGGEDAGDSGQPDDGGSEDGGNDAGVDGGIDAGPYANFQVFPAACTDPLCFEHPLTRDGLLGIWGTSPTDLWVVGENSAAYHYDGDRWRRAVVPKLDTQLRSIWGHGASWVAVGDKGVVYQWDAGSGRFDALDLGLLETTNLYAVSGWGDFVVAAGDQGTMVVLHPSGDLVTTVDPASAPPTLLGVWAFGDKAAWFVGGGGALYQLTPASYPATTPVSTDPFVDFQAVHGNPDGSVALAVGSGGKIYRNTNYQTATWTLAATGPDEPTYTSAWVLDTRAWLANANLDSVHGLSPPSTVFTRPNPAPSALRDLWAAPQGGGVFAVGDQGTILRDTSAFPSGAWAHFHGAVREYLYALHVTPDGRLYAAGEHQSLLQRIGDQWTPRQAYGSSGYRAVFAGNDSVWTGGPAGITRHLGDLDDDELVSAGAFSINDIWGFDGVPVYAVASNGKLFRYDAGEGEWVPHSQGTNVFGTTSLLAVDGTADGGTVYLSGNDGAVYRRLADGTFASLVLGPPGTALSDLRVFAEDSVWVVGAAGLVAHYDGGSWDTDTVTGLAMTGICGTPEALYASSFQALYRLDGGGWSKVGENGTVNLQGIACADGGVWLSGADGVILRHSTAP